TGTSKPFTSSVIISGGPEGQHVETIGVPQAIASTKTFPKPSYKEDR
ncbi:unnamed protein product, partial [marine sediment metagenome]